VKMGMVGLGRMGSNMSRRLMQGGHHCVVFDLNPQSVSQLAGHGAAGASSLFRTLAPGFDILRNAVSKDLPEDRRYDLNVRDIAEVWRRGSVVGSWLLDLAAMALRSRQEHTVGEKMLSAMRNQFGGHVEWPAEG
jgi:6-phosphogluconate dehydrogenase (decarboxylating)